VRKRMMKKYSIEFETRYPATCWDCPACAVNNAIKDEYYCRALFLRGKRSADGEFLAPMDFKIPFSSGEKRLDCPTRRVKDEESD
jgi:hypothetical protein